MNEFQFYPKKKKKKKRIEMMCILLQEYRNTANLDFKYDGISHLNMSVQSSYARCCDSYGGVLFFCDHDLTFDNGI
jgi:hypothetical protein